MRRTIAPLAGLFLASAFLAAAQLRGIFLVFGPRLRDHAAAAQGVIQGLPHWRSFQSRVLGPFFVEALSRLTGLTYADAYPFAVILFLLIFFLVLFLTARNLWNSTLAAAATALAAWAFNAMLMQGLWVYLWDYIDLIVFTLLTWAILTSQPLWFLALVILVEAFNRDLAFLLSLWLVFDAILRPQPSERRWPKLELHTARSQLAVALALLIVSYVVTEGIRKALFIREVGFELFPELVAIAPESTDPGRRFAVWLPINLRWVRFSFTHPLDSLYMVFNVMIAAIPLLAIQGLFSRHSALIRAGILHGGLWVVAIALGPIYETRVWLAFVPFAVLVGPVLLGGQVPRALAEPQSRPLASARELSRSSNSPLGGRADSEASTATEGNDRHAEPDV